MKTLVVVSVLLLPVFSLADPTPLSEQEQKGKAREMYKRAQVHYRTGDLDKAAAEFKESYELYPAAETLFNLAQTHRLLKNYEKAVFFYRQFLATGETGQADRKVIQERIAELEKIIEQQQHAQAAPPQGPEPPATGARVSPSQAAPPDSIVVMKTQEAKRAPAPTPVYRKWWFWTIIGGAVAAATAVGIGIGASSATQAPPAPETSLGVFRPYK